MVGNFLVEHDIMSWPVLRDGFATKNVQHDRVDTEYATCGFPYCHSRTVFWALQPIVYPL